MWEVQEQHNLPLYISPLPLAMSFCSGQRRRIPDQERLLLKHNVDSEEEGDPDSPANPDEEDSSDDLDECESLTPSEIREI